MSRRVFTLNEALAELLRDDEDDFLNGEGNVNEGSDSDESEDLEKKMNRRCRSLLKAQEMPLVKAARRTFYYLVIFIDRLDPTDDPLMRERN